MADIVFRYEAMESAVGKINELAGKYKAAADSFEESFIGATSQWEGDSKDKMIAFISGPVKEYMAVSVPALLETLAQLLKDNADYMKNADAQIAEKIPTSLS